MSRYLTIALFIIVCTACSNPADEAEQAMAAIHPKRTELEFRDLKRYPESIICGQYNAVSVMGEETGFDRFIIRDGKANKRPSDSDYTIYCSREPAKELQRLLGIAPVDRSNSTLMQILADFSQLSDALASYEKDMYGLPKGKDGLEELVASEVAVMAPRKYREGGYIEKLPQDPWHRPYLYEASQLGGVRGTYEIKSLGADGVPGGSGQDADVSTDHLEYLQHILAIGS